MRGMASAVMAYAVLQEFDGAVTDGIGAGSLEDIVNLKPGHRLADSYVDATCKCAWRVTRVCV